MPKAYLNHVEKLIRLFQSRLMLAGWSIKARPVAKLRSRRYHDGYSAEVDVDTRYQDIEISLSGKYYKKWQRKEYQEMAQDMCHEMIHVFTDPYYEFFWDRLRERDRKALRHINEQATERITSIIMAAIRPEEYLP